MSSPAEELKFPPKSGVDQKKTKKRSSRSAVEVKTGPEKPITVLVTNLSLLALELGGGGGAESTVARFQTCRKKVLR